MKVSGLLVFGLLAVLLGGCHQGEDHALYEWEMVIPYSPTADYPLMGAVSRYDTWRACRKSRTELIRNQEGWLPAIPVPGKERVQELVKLLRRDTWCLPAWPDTGRFAASDSENGRIRLPRDTPEHQRWLQTWQAEGLSK